MKGGEVFVALGEVVVLWILRVAVLVMVVVMVLGGQAGDPGVMQIEDEVVRVASQCTKFAT
jgi:hypothetical protein